jgi:hypothetical protein
VTKSPPLQGNTAAQIDEAMLRQEARHHLPQVAKRPTPPLRQPAAAAAEAKDERSKPLQDRIQEIEDFLKKFEAKG